MKMNSALNRFATLLRLGLFLGLALSLSACAWNYAGREGKVKKERPRPPAQTQVVTINAPDTPPADENGQASSPCGVPTFDVYFFSPETRVVKTIDCADRKVVNISRTPMGQTQFEEARQANLPPDTWYLLVDPRGIRTLYLSTDTLTRLSQHFDVRLIGKDSVNDLLVYEFLEADL